MRSRRVYRRSNLISKQNLITYISLVVLVLVISISLFTDLEFPTIEKDESIDYEYGMSNMKNVFYFSFLDESKKTFIQSQKIIMSDNSYYISADGIKGFRLNSSMQKIDFSSDHLLSNDNLNSFQLINNAKFRINKDIISANKFDFDTSANKVKASGNVKSKLYSNNLNDQILLKGNSIDYDFQKKIATFFEKINGQIKRSKAYEKSFKFTSSKGKVDLNKSQINLYENVKLFNDFRRLRAQEGVIYLANYNKKLKYYTLNDDVEVEEFVFVNNKKIKRVALSEKLEGHMSEKLIILSGFPKVLQGKDIVKGNLIKLYENNQVIEVIDSKSLISID